MKILPVIFGFSLCLCFVTADEVNCKVDSAARIKTIPVEWKKMVGSCTDLLKNQVQLEIKAAMHYMALGTHFSRDSVNRPGFSEFFFNAASEERQHAIKIIEYLLMRGQLTDDFSNLIKLSSIKVTLTEGNITPLEALKEALKLETEVTNSIRAIMDECDEPTKSSDKTNDYHLVDYLTTDFLDEQYKGQRELAGRFSTLGKMMQNMNSKGNALLAEFLFDKKLLRGEI